MNHGHYTCFLKNDRSNSWLQYDDSYVKEIPESKVRSQFAYILFYKRRDIAPVGLDVAYPSIVPS
jgi:ubiquitin C-terminal hydrolase